MCFTLVKISSEINHASYSLKVACYLYSVFVSNMIYYVLVYKLILCGVAFQIHALKGMSSGEQHPSLIQGALPSVLTYTLNKYLLQK